MNEDEQRAKEFLECIGNGKPIHQHEEDNDYLDYLMFGEEEEEKQ